LRIGGRTHSGIPGSTPKNMEVRRKLVEKKKPSEKNSKKYQRSAPQQKVYTGRGANGKGELFEGAVSLNGGERRK